MSRRFDSATFHKRHPHIPLFANGETADAIAALTGVEDGWQVFETTEDFEIDDVRVSAFSIPHDANDPTGYRIYTPQASVAIGLAAEEGIGQCVACRPV